MNQNDNVFARRLNSVLAASLVDRGELARHLGVSVPTINRWLNGTAAPNVYQFQAISHFFDLPYGWFLEEEIDLPSVSELSRKLGLSEDAVYGLLDLAKDADENQAVLAAMDAAVQAALDVADAVWEDLDRYADNVIAGIENNEKG